MAVKNSMFKTDIFDKYPKIKRREEQRSVRCHCSVCPSCRRTGELGVAVYLDLVLSPSSILAPIRITYNVYPWKERRMKSPTIQNWICRREFSATVIIYLQFYQWPRRFRQKQCVISPGWWKGGAKVEGWWKGGRLVEGWIISTGY